MIRKLMAGLEKISKLWWLGWATLLVSFVTQLTIPHLQFVKPLQNMLYPDSGWVGAVSFRLNDAPGYTTTSDRDLILLAHQFAENSRVTFLREGAAPEWVAAGAPAVSLMIEQSKPRTSGIPLFDVDLPPSTLVAASVSSLRGGAASRYTMVTPQWTKNLDQKGDLIVLTRNQMLETRTLYYLSILILPLAAFFMSRYANLEHPDESEDSDFKSEPAAGD